METFHSSPQRPTWAEIDLDNLAFNYRSVRKFIGAEVKCMAVVTADAYGHGSVRCAQRLTREGVDWLAVATFEEGAELRDAGIRTSILVLGGLWPEQENAFLDLDLTPTVFRIDQAEVVNRAATARDMRASVHVKIDTGMGRIGFQAKSIDEVAARLASLKSVEVEGLMTHFAVADELGNEFTGHQMAKFAEAVETLRRHGIAPAFTDLANSPGAVAHPASRADMVRLGGVLYGLAGDVLPRGIEVPELRPVMSLHSRIALVKTIARGESVGYGRTFKANRDSIIATVPIGYHDGLSRSLSNKGKMIVNGTLAPVVGRISMDWTTIDVTDVPAASVGDLVTIIGTQNDVSITAEEMAAERSTISYEVTCGIGGRVPRIFREAIDELPT